MITSLISYALPWVLRINFYQSIDLSKISYYSSIYEHHVAALGGERKVEKAAILDYSLTEVINCASEMFQLFKDCRPTLHTNLLGILFHRAR